MAEMAARDPSDSPGRSAGSSSDWVPRPDPTTRTNEIVEAATADLRREAGSQREIIMTRVDGVDALLGLVTAEMRGQPALTAQAIAHLQALHEERFAAIQQQFTERDVRGEQEKKASKEALDAALLAQKESVSQQNDANTTAATKTEISFTKQNDQTAVLIANIEKSLSDRLTELKERIDRGEGSSAGAATFRTERRLDTGALIGMLVAGISTIIAIAAIIALVIHG